MFNLPNSTILKIFLSNVKSDQLVVQQLVEEFLSIKTTEDMTIPELSILAFGNKYPINYQKTRCFVQSLNKDLLLENKNLIALDLALIYNEGKELKQDCARMGRKYRTGGAYLFTLKMLGLLLLAKNENFREFVRSRYDEQGQKFYVPYNLEKRLTNTRRYVLAYTD